MQKEATTSDSPSDFLFFGYFFFFVLTQRKKSDKRQINAHAPQETISTKEI